MYNDSFEGFSEGVVQMIIKRILNQNVNDFPVISSSQLINKWKKASVVDN